MWLHSHSTSVDDFRRRSTYRDLIASTADPSMNTPDIAPTTRDRILNAAERLFAQRGFYGVTIRQITREAGVDVALASYYFGPKADLFRAVLERRAGELHGAI